VPPAELRGVLAQRIDSLAERLGTPRFDPHVTLLAGVEAPGEQVVAGSRRLVGQLGRVGLRLTRAGGRGEFFRCVFLEVEPEPPLVDAHRRAHDCFRRGAEGPFFPHLSLVYGTLDGEVKNALLRELERDAAWRVVTFGSELWVVLTEGTVGEWRTLARIPLPRP
jgi:hypothetical protein